MRTLACVYVKVITDYSIRRKGNSRGGEKEIQHCLASLNPLFAYRLVKFVRFEICLEDVKMTNCVSLRNRNVRVARNVGPRARWLVDA